MGLMLRRALLELRWFSLFLTNESGNILIRTEIFTFEKSAYYGHSSLKIGIGENDCQH